MELIFLLVILPVLAWYFLYRIIENRGIADYTAFVSAEAERYAKSVGLMDIEVDDDVIIIDKKKEENKGYMPSYFKPENFKQYIGQQRVKKIILNYLLGCKKRKRIFPHTLLFAKPGMGKTTLARIIAKTLKVNFIEIIGSKVGEDFEDFKKKIKQVDGGVLFIDEIHALERSIAEKIYPLMEDFILEGKSIKPFTLIGATTELGEIIRDRKPFYDRFKLILQLEDYEEKDIIKIIKQYKKYLFKEEETENWFFKSIAENSRLTPRIAIRYLESGIYFGGNKDKNKLKEMFNSFGVIYKGITETDIKVLNYLNKSKAVGIQGLTAFLDVDKFNYLHFIEPYLLKQELILRTPRGRIISEKGKEILKKIERRKRSGIKVI